MAEKVNHPSHYNTGKYEVIDVIDDWGLNFELGNVVKYVARAGHKENTLEDLQKARWYLEREINNYTKRVIEEHEKLHNRLREMSKMSEDNVKTVVINGKERKIVRRKLKDDKQVFESKITKRLDDKSDNKGVEITVNGHKKRIVANSDKRIFTINKNDLSELLGK